MKNVLLTICLVAILLIAGCNSEVSSEKKVRLWLASNESTSVRGGYLVDPNTEIGGEFSCQDDELRTIGVYVIRHSSDGVVQVPNPLPFAGWPEIFEGNTYWGAGMFWDFRDIKGRDAEFSPFAGIRLEDLFFTEVRANSAEPTTFMFGVQKDF